MSINVNDVSRDLEDYRTSGELKIRMKERNVGVYEVEKAIEEGEIKPSRKGGNQVEFHRDYPADTLIVPAVINERKKNVIKTVMWEVNRKNRFS